MRKFISAFVFMVASITSCAIVTVRNVKFKQQYQGVDIMAQRYVDEFMTLASNKKIGFNNLVTIGFKKINQDNVVGLCTYGPGWREIDIDEIFWSYSNEADRIALIFHELTHCYCARDHDWAKDSKYPETDEARIKEAEEWQKKGGDRPGRLEDGCPSSLMYPIVVDNQCLKDHYDHYVSEMFDRCRPY